NKGAGSLDAELTVRHLAADAEEEPYTQRVNLLSHSARESLERALRGQFGKDVKWITLISTAYARVRAAYLEADRGMHVSKLPEVTERRFLIEDLLPHGHPTLLFGDGSSGKSMLAKAMALAIALGGQFCRREVMHGGVLYVDYETDSDGGESFRFRLQRLVMGYELDPITLEDVPLHYWPARGIPLADQADSLRRFIDKHGIVLVIVDSGGVACGGKPEDAVVALAYFAALAKLGCTTLTICHVSKEEGKDGTSEKPYGSVYWHNLARRTWFVSRQEGNSSIDLNLYCRKVNDGARPKPIGYQILFKGSAGPVEVTEIGEAPAENSLGATGLRIHDLLVESTPLNIREISDALEIPFETVKKTLQRGGQAYKNLGPPANPRYSV
ncbi:MAG: AAA family ATPase, partial [Gemmatimonadaceae bacterium]|nr:AAA family ATPase [Gemmatimonadaceae bacterium]